MNRLLQGAVATVAVLVFVQWGATSCSLRAERARANAEQERANILATEAAAERARADGMTVALVESQADAVRDALAADSMLARLREDLEASRVRATQLVRLVTEAEGRIEALADSVRTDSLGAVTSFAGRFDDGYLSALWRAEVPSQTLELDYATRDSIRLVTGVTGDSRLWFSAMSANRRARVMVDTIVVDLPEPETVVRHSFWRTVRDVGLGLVIGAAGWEIAR